MKAIFVSNAAARRLREYQRGRRAARTDRRAARPRDRQRRSRTRSRRPTRPGAVFMSFFTTFGSFSIAAGILLIFLIFVMLAAERRGELGIARAVGTRRGHLVQMFLYEGLAYDLLAAAVARARRSGRRLRDGPRDGLCLRRRRVSFTISYSVTPASLAVGYAIGVLLTLVVVAFSAWRVSRMNIVDARSATCPSPRAEKARRRRWLARRRRARARRLADRRRREREGRGRRSASASRS